MKRYSLCIALMLVCLCPGMGLASNARDYVPLPPGTTIINLYYNHYFGNNVYVKGKKVSSNTNYTGNIGILRPIHYMSIGPFTTDPQAIIPFGEVELAGQRSSGVGDITLASTIWFVDNKENSFFWAYTPFLTIPSGPYRRENAINLGANRWATKQEMCIGKGFADRFWFEWVVAAEFYTDNIDAQGGGGRRVTSSKDPVFTSEVHLSYNITKPFFVSLDYYYTNGGETTLDGRRLDDWVSTHTLGTSFAYMLNANMQLMVDFQTDVAVRSGMQANKIGARLAYVF